MRCWKALSSKSGLSKGDGEGVQPVIGVVADDGRRQSRIEAAAEICANRHIGAQPDARRINQQALQFIQVVGFVCRASDSGVKSELPVALDGIVVPACDRQVVPGRHLTISAKHGARGEGAPVGEDLLQRRGVDLGAARPGTPGSL